MEVRFMDAEQYTCRYQRNNKRSGLKNLRCFPMCTDEHKMRGFCGRPAFVDVSNPSGAPVYVFAAFYKLPGKAEPEPGPALGSEFDMPEARAKVRHKDGPFLPWMDGELMSPSSAASPGVTVPAQEGPAADALRRAANIRFVVNRGKKGWHYGWTANKHTCEAEHVLRVHVFERRPTDDRLVLAASGDSPPFTIFCRRRQRQNLERLPAQLKQQLELQDQSRRGAQLVPKSIPVDKSAPSLRLVHQPQPPESFSMSHLAAAAGAAAATTSTSAGSLAGAKRRAPRAASGGGAKKARGGKAGQGPLETPVMPVPPSSAMFTPAELLREAGRRYVPRDDEDSPMGMRVPRTTLEERRTLLFHVIRSLLRLDVKGSQTLQELAAESNGGINFGSETNSEVSVEDFSQTISDCLDSFTAGERMQDLHPHSAASSGATASFSSGAGAYAGPRNSAVASHPPAGSFAGDLASLEDFRPFDLDFTVLEQADWRGGSGGGGASHMSQASAAHARRRLASSVPVPKFADIMKEFALYLVEEREFTATITSAFSGASLDIESSSQCALALSVLLDLLESFLRRFRITVDELYHLVKTQVWEKDKLDAAASPEQPQPSEQPQPERDAAAAQSMMFPGGVDCESLQLPPPPQPPSTDAVSAPSGCDAPPDMVVLLKEEGEPEIVPPAAARENFVTSIRQFTGSLKQAALAAEEVAAAHSPRTSFDADASAASARGAPFVSCSASSDAEPAQHQHQQQPQHQHAHAAPPPPPPPPLLLLPSQGPLTPRGHESHSAQLLLGLQNELLFVPDQDPRNNLAGDWVREEETLNILESIRESVGVPFILRKMQRYMETNLRITFAAGAMHTQNNPKLFSSGFQRYILDGRMHAWDLPPPLPTEKPQVNTTYEATLRDGLLWLALYYSPRRRIVRETRKTAAGDRLDSVVRFQFRDDTNKPWTTRLCARCCAVRASASSPDVVRPVPEDVDDDELVSWLTAPCDFSMSL